jgi:hypothetical protein
MSIKKNFFMKTNLLSLAAILSIGFFTSNLEAQTSATGANVTGTSAGAKLIKPMTLSQTSPLHFGTINVIDGVAGTVVLPSSTLDRAVTGGVALSTVLPYATNAAYSVTGTKNTKYALTLPTTITVKETEFVVGTTLGAGTMDITALTARFTNVPGVDATESTLSSTGTDSFTLGGTLTVATSQLPGIYAGTFNVSVDYN